MKDQPTRNIENGNEMQTNVQTRLNTYIAFMLIKGIFDGNGLVILIEPLTCK